MKAILFLACLFAVIHCDKYNDCIEEQFNTNSEISYEEVKQNCFQFIEDSPFDYCVYTNQQEMYASMPQCQESYTDECMEAENEIYAYCGEQAEEEEASKMIAQAYEFFEEYKGMFANEEEFKAGLEKELEKLKEKVNEMEPMPEGEKTLDNELDEAFMEGELEFDNLYQNYSNDAAQLAANYTDEIQEGEQKLNEYMGNGLKDEFQELEEEMKEGEEMYKEYKGELDENLAKDWTKGEDREWLEGQIEEQKKEATKEIEEEEAELNKEMEEEWLAQKEEIMNEYYEGIGETDYILQNVIDKLRADHEGEPEWEEKLKYYEENKANYYQKLDEFMNENLEQQGEEELNKYDQMLEDEIAQFNPDDYLDDPKTKENYETAKVWFQQEEAKIDKMSKKQQKKAKEMVEKLKQKWEKSGKAEYATDKKKFDEWLAQAMIDIENPEAMQSDYQKGKDKIKTMWQKAKGKIEEKAEEKGLNLNRQQMFDKVKEEINAVTKEDIDSAVDKAEQKGEKLKTKLDEAIPDEKIQQYYEEYTQPTDAPAAKKNKHAPLKQEYPPEPLSDIHKTKKQHQHGPFIVEPDDGMKKN